MLQPFEAVLFIGIQATGKSSFYLERFHRTHVRINGDMLKTRRREELLLQACFEGKTSFVLDKMNLTRAERLAVIGAARAAGFAVRGFFFPPDLAAALQRNARRDPVEQVPEAALRGAMRDLQPPAREEGYDELSRVTMDGRGGFVVSPI